MVLGVRALEQVEGEHHLGGHALRRRLGQLHLDAVAGGEAAHHEEPQHHERRGVELAGLAIWTAAAVAFLASDEAGFITGVALPVDAGMLGAMPMVMSQYMLQVPLPSR